MKKVLRKTGRIFIVFLGIILAFLSMTTIYHHVALGFEKNQITPNGMLVEVNGHNIHVYTEGQKNNRPTLVFLAGSGTATPVYDFQHLYQKLSHEYRIAVVEKAGYGYSDIVEVKRDIDTMLAEVRQALAMAGEKEPYVLIPHSMSGLEATYWAQQYSEEVAAIIGLDMAVPKSYEYFDFSSVNQMMTIGRLSVWLGLHRIPGIYGLHSTSLTPHQLKQQKLLMYRNAVNIDYILEGQVVYDNAMKVQAGGAIDVPLLMFVSDGIQMGDYWIPCQKEFAQLNDAEMILLDTGHYVHYDEADDIAKTMLFYLAGLE